MEEFLCQENIATSRNMKKKYWNCKGKGLPSEKSEKNREHCNDDIPVRGNHLHATLVFFGCVDYVKGISVLDREGQAFDVESSVFEQKHIDIPPRLIIFSPFFIAYSKVFAAPPQS